MTTLHVHPHFNPEEAAHAAAEYLASGFRSLPRLICRLAVTNHLGLDNLQAEIQFLTDEIKEKDIRITSQCNLYNAQNKY